MKIAFELLAILSILGAADVLYFHIYKFRLYAQPGSVAEEVTHLIRAAVFVAITAIVTFSEGSLTALWALLGLAALDLVNNAVDVLLERKSREPLGGLPSLEYLIHILATFLVGLTVASVWFSATPTGFVPLEPTTLHHVRGLIAITIGIGMFSIEAGLFGLAIRARAQVSAAA